MPKSFFRDIEIFLSDTGYFADFVELLCGVIPQNYTKSEVSETVGATLNEFHLAVEAFRDAVVFCKDPRTVFQKQKGFTHVVVNDSIFAGSNQRSCGF